MYLDPNNFQSSVISDVILANEQTRQDLMLVSTLNAKLSTVKEADGQKKWKYSIHGLSEFGDTPMQAAQDLNSQFYTQKP